MFQESESTMMSYVLDIKWLSGCIEGGDHTRGARRQQVTPFYWSTVADWWWGLIWLMIDHCYVINESFTHPSDKWMICVATIMFIYSYFIYKLPHKFPNNLKALEISKISWKMKTELPKLRFFTWKHLSLEVFCS